MEFNMDFFYRIANNMMYWFVRAQVQLSCELTVLDDYPHMQNFEDIRLYH